MIFDIYEKNTLDMLAYVPNPARRSEPVLRTSLLPATAARNWPSDTKGGEDDFTYNLNANISMYRNEVTDLGAPVDSLNQPIFTGNVFGSGDFVAITDIGLPIATFWGETAGIYQTDEEAMADTAQANAVAGDVIFVDQNGDGVINNEDKVVIGNPHPAFTYGFTAGAKYKNFDFNLFLQGSHGNDIYKGMFRYDLNTPTCRSLHWTVGRGGHVVDTPRVTHSDLNQNNRVSDRFIEDGSYLRIKSLMVGTPCRQTPWSAWAFPSSACTPVRTTCSPSRHTRASTQRLAHAARLKSASTVVSTHLPGFTTWAST